MTINITGFISPPSFSVKSALDFPVVANNTATISLTVLDSNGLDFPLTGYSAIWVVRSPTSATPAVKKTSSAGDITISSNVLTWNLDAADTIDLQNGDYAEYEHEMIVIDSNGNPVTITNGDQEITWGTLTVRKQIAVQ
jgi:hypothetical protein